VGQEFAGRVSGVTNFGVFVELTDIYVEGLIHISTLPEDYYQFDAVRHVLSGERTGRSFQIGNELTIQVARVDLDKCEIDFVLKGMPLVARSSRARDDSDRGDRRGKRDGRGKPKRGEKRGDKSGERRGKRRRDEKPSNKKKKRRR
jgi:ribonuclease R